MITVPIECKDSNIVFVSTYCIYNLSDLVGLMQ